MHKVLIVEDDPAIQSLIRETLEIEPWTIIVAGNGAEAVETALAEKPDLILLDISLPDVSGLEVCRNLCEQESLKDTRIMILTAHAQESARQDALNAGAHYFLSKPFSPMQLLQLIGEIL
ncbi:MAG: response regulator [Armatimonadetes bacterium]|nr:response regulator [Armatimonadota bacterium]